VIDNKGIHESFTDQQREQERETVMSSRVGTIVLERSGLRGRPAAIMRSPDAVHPDLRSPGRPAAPRLR
jgi:hypothetical protein